MFGLKIRRALLATAAALLSVPGVALANVDNPNPDLSVNPTGNRKFDPAFFATYAPVTALDMVRRIPGFSIDQREGRRGFGENAGNVLIDGDRPSTKSDDIATILSRIAQAKSRSYCFRSKRAQTPKRKARGKWLISSASPPQRLMGHMMPPSWRDRVMVFSRHLIHRQPCAVATLAMR